MALPSLYRQTWCTALLAAAGAATPVRRLLGLAMPRGRPWMSGPETKEASMICCVICGLWYPADAATASTSVCHASN